MAYKPISDYGLIGDMHSAALIGLHGSIDWLCFPQFDSPSVFAAILDDAEGGRFHLGPSGAYTSRQLCWPDTISSSRRSRPAASATEATSWRLTALEHRPRLAEMRVTS